MCLPALALAAIATVAGAGMSYAGNEQAKDAGLSALHSEENRQQALTAQQQGYLDKSNAAVQSLQDPNAQNAAIDNRRAQFVNALNGAPSTQGSLPGDSSAPQVVQDAAAKTSGAQHAFSLSQAGNEANLAGFGDQMLGTNIALNRDSASIGQLATTKQDSANVLNSELAAAKFKGGDLRGLGSLAQMVGGALAGGSLMGAGAAGGFAPVGAATNSAVSTNIANAMAAGFVP